MLFEEVINQQGVKDKLRKSVQEKRLPHAQLLLGPEGSGGLPLALAYAQYINCEQPTETDSCGSCPSCQKAAKGIHPDIHFSFPVIRKKSNQPPISDHWIEEWREFLKHSPYQNDYQWLQFINAENKQGNITVNECQKIINKLNLKTYEGHNKVMIMWRPEYLGKNGNVLLKIIEEPPPNTVFLLVAQNQNALLNTLLSRLQIVKVPPLTDQSIQQALQEKYEVSEQDAQHIAHLSDGNFAEAIQHIEEDNEQLLKQLSQWLYICQKEKGIQRVKWIDQIGRLGRESQKHFIKYTIHILRETLLYKHHNQYQPRVNKAELGRIKKLAQRLATPQLNNIIGHFDRAYYAIERNANPKPLFFTLSHYMSKSLNKEWNQSIAS